MSDAEDYRKRYKNDYELWMQEIMGATITPDQRIVANGLQEHKFVSASSGTTTGKTTLAATTALWFFSVNPEAKVVCTAPTGHQLEDLLFAEMLAWKRRIKFDMLRDAIQVIKDKFFMSGYRDWYIVARTIPKDSKDKLGDVLAGFHAPSLLYIVDEASGVPAPVFKGIEGSMIQKNCSCLLVGNPTRPTGYFYDTHHKHKDQWFPATLSSANSPFVQQEWIERMRNLHGEDSDFFRTKILGKFPLGGGSSLITIDQVRDAMFRHSTVTAADFDDMIVAGFDPAAGLRDYSILTPRKGAYIFEPVRVRQTDTVDLIPNLITECQKAKVRELYVEYNGVGISVCDQLRRRRLPFKFWKVVTNTRANDPEAYRNLRAELYVGLANKFDELYLPDHDRYIHEFPEINLEEDKEPAQIEDKKKLKSRLGFSPDFADSVMLSTFRRFNFNGDAYSVTDVGAYQQINEQLVQESMFEKI